jgi:hypothetical protein
MKKVIIYRVSKNPQDDDELYLFREVWKLDDVGNYKMIDNGFVKVVSKKWLENRNLYYGCRISNDDEEAQNIL